LTRAPLFFADGLDQPLPEPEPEDEPSTVMDELNLAFLDALCDDNLERMEYFYALGADVNHRNIGAAETPLHFAVCREDTKFAQWLIDHGANVNAEACHKMTPLHWAARLGQVEMVEVLVMAGCEMHPKSDRGILPYWYTNKEQYDCKVPEERRKAIQALLPNCPLTQIITGRGPIIFGRDDPDKMAREIRERDVREKNKTRVAKNAAERAPKMM
jgi:ankyrin repeat protein